MLENCRIWIPLSFSSACCDPSGGEKRGFWTRKGPFHIFFFFSRFLFWGDYIVTGSRICKTFSSPQVKCSTGALTKFKVFLCVSIRQNFMDLNWSFCCQIIWIGFIYYVYLELNYLEAIRFPTSSRSIALSLKLRFKFYFPHFLPPFFRKSLLFISSDAAEKRGSKKIPLRFFFFCTLSREIGSCKQSVKKSAQNLTRHYSFR